MTKRTPNPCLVKIHRSYAVDEIARALDVHKNTVRTWIKSGLAPIDQQRPLLFHGATLRAFLMDRRAKAKRVCPPGHFYCLRCRAPKLPVRRVAEYLPITATSGNLRGRCPTCSCLIFRRISTTKIGAMEGLLRITIRQEDQRIRETRAPSPSCESKAEPTLT